MHDSQGVGLVDRSRAHAQRGRWQSLLSGRLIVGLLLLVLGALWTLDNLKLVESERITRWWPALLLAWGICRLTGICCRWRPLSGAIWTFVGGWLLLRALNLVPIGLFDLWPLALILLGSSLVYRAWRGRAPAGMDTDDQPLLNAFALMGGVDRKVLTERFRGGEVSAVMGGVVIDLRSAKLAEDRASIDVFAMWGGIDLVVPIGWRVVSEVTPIMGGFEDNTVPATETNAPTLVVRGLVLMGGVEVKHTTDEEGSESRAEARRRRRERRIHARFHVDTEDGNRPRHSAEEYARRPSEHDGPGSAPNDPPRPHGPEARG